MTSITLFMAAATRGH